MRRAATAVLLLAAAVLAVSASWAPRGAAPEAPVESRGTDAFDLLPGSSATVHLEIQEHAFIEYAPDPSHALRPGVAGERDLSSSHADIVRDRAQDELERRLAAAGASDAKDVLADSDLADGLLDDAQLAAAASRAPASEDPTSSGADWSLDHFEQTPFVPPDPVLAVGPQRLVGMVNGGVRIYNRPNIKFIASASNTAFFGTGAGPFDPQVQYDPYLGVFVAVIVQGRDLPSFVHIAVSKSSTPNTLTSSDWRFHKIPVDSGVWCDYPILGLDSVNYYVTGNIYSGPVFQRAYLWVIPKAAYQAGNVGTIQGAQLYYAPLSAGIFTVRPATHLLNEGGVQSFFFVHKRALGQELAVNSFVTWEMQNPNAGVGSTFTVTSRGIVGGAQDTGNFQPAKQKGSSREISMGDERLTSAVFVDDVLYFAHAVTTGANTEFSRIALYSWDSGPVVPPSSVSRQYIQLPSMSLGFPAVAVNSAGDRVVTFTASSASMYPSAWYWRDPVANATEFAPRALQAGLAPYTASQFDESGALPDVQRWGDYSHVAVDPSDSSRFWLTQEYCGESSGWRSRMVSFRVNEIGSCVPCNDLGPCIDEQCVCDQGLQLDDAGEAQYDCPNICLNRCNSNGLCLYPIGICRCLPGFYTEDCGRFDARIISVVLQTFALMGGVYLFHRVRTADAKEPTLSASARQLTPADVRYLRLALEKGVALHTCLLCGSPFPAMSIDIHMAEAHQVYEPFGGKRAFEVYQREVDIVERERKLARRTSKVPGTNGSLQSGKRKSTTGMQPVQSSTSRHNPSTAGVPASSGSLISSKSTSSKSASRHGVPSSSSKSASRHRAPSSSSKSAGSGGKYSSSKHGSSKHGSSKHGGGATPRRKESSHKTGAGKRRSAAPGTIDPLMAQFTGKTRVIDSLTQPQTDRRRRRSKGSRGDGADDSEVGAAITRAPRKGSGGTRTRRHSGGKRADQPASSRDRKDSGGKRSDRKDSGGKRSDGKRSDGKRSDGKRSDGKRSVGKRSDGKRSVGKRSDGKRGGSGSAKDRTARSTGSRGNARGASNASAGKRSTGSRGGPRKGRSRSPAKRANPPPEL